MATNDFYKAIEALKAQKKTLEDEYNTKMRKLKEEHAVKDKQLDTAIDILYDVGNVCPDCGGSGRVHEYTDMHDDRGSIVSCKKCNGTGTYTREVKGV